MIAHTDLGERLWELREERGWSQKRTAREAGLSHVTIAHLETGKVEPRLPTLRKLARTFDMTVDELLEGEPGVPLVPALELAAMYVADDEARSRALGAATTEERERYAATIERVIADVVFSVYREGDWEAIATDETRPEGERRVAREQLARIWAHIDRLSKLRAEATDEEEPQREELAEFIAAHASAA